MDIVLKTEYWSDLNARAAFKRFMRTIHGLDLSLWESAPVLGRCLHTLLVLPR